nr:hypothetical protein [Tanacetum cinerariifolium]
DSLVIAIPVGPDKGHSLATIDIEYEWRPPRCSTCLIFDHTNEICPKVLKEVVTKTVKQACDNDGFVKIFLHLDWSSNGAFCDKDSTAIGSCMDISMREFNECVENIEVLDVQQSGLKVSDHSPSVLIIPTISVSKPKPFKFYNILTHNDQFKEKAKVQWLKEGDSNSAYFHKAVKIHVSRSRIDVVMNAEGILFENEVVPEAFITRYEMFLGLAGDTYTFNTVNLFKTCLNEQVALDMVRTVSKQEVKEAMFYVGDDKYSDLDGYTVAFFKEAWEIIGSDVTNAICEFFTNGTLLKELNHTIIALIPKVKSPSRVNGYRPISCCNVLFKCISKIFSNCIKHSLKDLISPNQSAFVPGRSISDNILLTQELMHSYHLDRGTPRCAFKIMECVTTTSYSICINGSLHGYFHGKRGLRQGDHLSPYLFTLVMKILTLMLKRKVEESGLFTYHRYCSNLDLINLCFADDLFIFSYEDVQSVTIIKEALEEFKCASGLVPSLPKSTAYFCNALNHIKLSILQILTFEEGCLSVKYLGVSLVSSRLMVQDCKELVEKIMRGFLWSHVDIKKGKAKVAWEVESLWVRWIHAYKLNGRIFWDVPLRGKVKDIIHDGSLVWPPVLLEKYPLLHSYVVPVNEGVLDRLEWRYNGVTKAFSVNQPVVKRRTIKSIIVRLVIAASAYYIWQERNWRLFKSKKRTVSHVIDCVVSSVRLNLLSCKLKKSRDGQKYATLWDLPEALFV